MSATSRAGVSDGEWAHGCLQLPSVQVCAYNSELRDRNGFVGDRGSKRAFQAILNRARESLAANGHDPLGAEPTESLSKKALDRILTKGDPEAAGLVLGAIETFAGELTVITQRLLRTAGWRGVQRIAVGGGLRACRVGELAIGRASVLLRTSGEQVELRPVRHHPDEAGLVGATQLVPAWMMAGHDCILAVDIGGSNMRAGLVELNLDKADDLRGARVMGLELWRHRDDNATRDKAIAHLCDMLAHLVQRARRDKLRLAPFVGVGCPGLVNDEGVIERGAQNLPGKWEGARFRLTDRIKAALPVIGGQPSVVVLHNDAVVQGLSEVPWMQDVKRWGVLTIGTGLGNASFENRQIGEAVPF